jgi:hypothetical protein
MIGGELVNEIGNFAIDRLTKALVRDPRLRALFDEAKIGRALFKSLGATLSAGSSLASYIGQIIAKVAADGLEAIHKEIASSVGGKLTFTADDIASHAKPIFDK